MSKIECRHTDIVVKKDGTSVCSDCGDVDVVSPSVTRAREFVKETKTMIDAIELERRRRIRAEREALLSGTVVGLPAQPSHGAPTAGGADPNVRPIVGLAQKIAAMLIEKHPSIFEAFDSDVWDHANGDYERCRIIVANEIAADVVKIIEGENP